MFFALTGPNFNANAFAAKALEDGCRFAVVDDPGVAVDERYLVVPERPSGTDGWDEAALAALVTRDAMIGTGLARRPGEAAP